MPSSAELGGDAAYAFAQRRSPSSAGEILAAVVYVRGMLDDSCSEAELTNELVCLECGERSGEARGWQAHLYEGELLVYCCTCAWREFEKATEVDLGNA